MTWWCYRVRWQGVEFEGSPDFDGDQFWMRLRHPAPADGFEEVAPGCHVRPVPASECDEIAFVTTVCEWRGQTCQVHDERDDQLLLEYTGGSAVLARDLGLERRERGVYRRWVARSEVMDMRENVVVLDP